MTTLVSSFISVLNRELDGTSDRSCVIVATSMLDYQLTECLKAVLAPAPQAEDSLFDVANAPLSSLSAKITLAHRLRLIGAQGARDLHLIRKLRNDFAHSFRSHDFSERSAADRVGCLVRSLRIAERCPSLLAAPYNSTRGNFIVCMLLILSHFESLRSRLPAFTELASDPLYTDVITDSTGGS